MFERAQIPCGRLRIRPRNFQPSSPLPSPPLPDFWFPPDAGPDAIMVLIKVLTSIPFRALSNIGYQYDSTFRPADHIMASNLSAVMTRSSSASMMAAYTTAISDTGISVLLGVGGMKTAFLTGSGSGSASDSTGEGVVLGTLGAGEGSGVGSGVGSLGVGGDVGSGVGTGVGSFGVGTGVGSLAASCTTSSTTSTVSWTSSSCAGSSPWGSAGVLAR